LACPRGAQISLLLAANELLTKNCILQPWITPSIFDNTGDDKIVDEYTFGQYQDHSKALITLTNHWDTWITESDFEAIAKAG
jgi:glucan 1,3-beta-glucosidase